MRIPGIRNICVTAAGNVPVDVELAVAAGLTPNLDGVVFTPVAFVGQPVCNVDESNENNGSECSVELTFNVEHRQQLSRHCFVVTLVSGESFLIGNAANVPAVSSKDTSAGPETTNQATIKVSLRSFCAWVSLGDLIPMSEGAAPVVYESWREITEQEVHDIVGDLDL